MKKRMTMLVGCLLILFVSGGCSNKEEEVYFGTIEGKKQTIYSQLEGEVDSIETEEQQEIKANDLLCSLKDDYYELQRKEAEAALSNVEVKKKEAEEQGATDNQLKMIEGELNQANALLEQVEYTKSQTKINAPKSGIVSEWLVSEGDFVIVGTPLVNILTDEPYELTIFVPQKKLSDFSLNQSVTITSVAHSDKSFEGFVKQIADEAVFSPQNNETLDDQAEKVFPIQIRVEDNNQLKPGMDVSVEL
ncbi:MAG TPA: HlyD family efflux transporter periplasmic adaptor subunit [Bacillota bacterium]